MKVLHQDRKQDLIRLRADTLDDLWHLYQLVQPGDTVTASTTRTPSSKDDKLRPEKLPKQRMTLTLEVEDVEFHEHTDRLRITGVIVEGPQDHGSHHTFNVEPGDDLSIVKPWRDHHLDRIQEAVEATDRPQLVVVAVEFDEAAIAVVRHFGVREVATVRAEGLGKGAEGLGPGGGGGKAGKGGGRDAFFDEVLQTMEPLRPDEHPVLVVGPGFSKEDFVEHAKKRDPEATSHWIIDSTSQGGRPGIQEALNRGSAKEVAEEARVAKESRAVEAVLSAIAKDEPVAYGPDDVRQALEAGAVERLLVTDALVRAGEAEAYLDRAEAVGAETLIISTHHEAGEKLESFGGVAATLRFAMR